MKKSLAIFLLFIITFHAYSQLDSLKASVTSMAAFGSEGYLPFHIGYNQFGRFNPNTNDAFLQASVYYPILSKGRWKIETGLDYIVKPVLDESFFHQGFLNIKYGKIALRFGKNEIQNDWYNDELGAGNMFQSQNARTISKIGLGIWEYTPVPFFNYLEVKGGAEIGLLEDERVVQDAYIHEKFAYIKTAQLPVNLFVGLNHQVLFGGTNQNNGRVLPSNFFEAFFAQNAPNSGNRSDSINAAGAHFGVFDLGFELPIENSLLKASFQQPISDASGYQTNFTANKDYILSVELQLEDHPFLRGLMYENYNTVHQSGEGLPDPRVNGQFYLLGELRAIEDYDQFVLDEFGLEVDNISWPEFRKIVMREANFGYKYSGRDDHYNNGQYPFGHTFHQFVIGNPLFTTKDRFETATGETLKERLFVINNRIVAHHVGIAGYYKDIDINLLFTWSYNYGTYAGKYNGSRGSWNYDPDYYFTNVVGLQYMALELAKSHKNWDMNLNIGVDTGDFGTNVGGSVGLTYHIAR